MDRGGTTVGDGAAVALDGRPEDEEAVRIHERRWKLAHAPDLADHCWTPEPEAWLTATSSVEGRILIVDDEETNTRLLADMLETAGFADIERCTDPHEALSRYRRYGADLVIVDLHMPGIDGDELIRQVNATVPEDELVPVMVITSDVTDEARDRAFHAGAADFMTKPFDLHECTLRVRNLLHIRHVTVAQARKSSRLTARIRFRDAFDERAARQALAIHARLDGVCARGGPTMVFQPIASLGDGRLVGVEALARFDTGDGRTPDAWFAEAVSVGRGVELEIAAIERALENLDALARGAFLSINASPATIVDPRLGEVIGHHDGSRIVVELTEHEQVQDYDALLAAIDRVRRLGARIAMDDAGTGFAGLQQILRLGPDIIKLDRFLIEGIDGDPVRQALVTALVSFSAAIDATLLGEGIETDGELTVLRSLGVPLGQGYLLGRPAPMPGQRI